MAAKDYRVTAADAHHPPSSMQLKAWAVPGALTLVAVVYGSWSLIAKVALASGEVAPLILASYRCFGGAFVMLSAYHVLFSAGVEGKSVGLSEISVDDWPRFALLGVLMACNIGGNITALKLLPALTVSVFQPMLPVIAGIASSFLGIEELSLHRIAGILLATTGAAVVVVMGAYDQATTAAQYSFGGILCLLVNVCGGAMYMVLQKGVVHSYQPALAASAAFFLAGVVLTIAAACTSGLDPFAWRLGDSRKALCALLFSIFLTTAFNYIVLAWATRESTPTTVTSFQTLQPMAAALLQWLFLGKLVTLGQTIGGAAIVGGLICFARAPDTKAPFSEPPRQE